MRKVFAFSVLFLFSIEAFPSVAADFSRCQLYAPNFQQPYGMGLDGKLMRPKRDPNLVSYANENGIEIAVVKMNPNVMKIKKATYSIHSENGKPLYYSEESGPSKVTFTFGYDGEKCYVAESSIKVIEVKTNKTIEQVSYNKDMCDQVLRAADTLNESKLQECGAVFSSVELVRNQFQNKFYGQGRGLISPMAGILFPAAPTPTSKAVPSAMDLITGCKGARFFYPEDGIKSSSPSAEGGFEGGIVGVPATEAR
ncbi:MAG: hypothetical protein ACXVB9_07825 [Bdellovibrionota bacterium]